MKSQIPPPEFRRLFEASPVPCLALTPELVIFAVTEAYLAATMTRREEILGRGVFEVFPDNPDDPSADGARNLRASLERVLRDRLPDTMAVQRYDVKLPEAGAVAFEERYWSPVNSPVLDAKGEVVAIVHRVEDVTEYVRLEKLGRTREAEARSLRTRTERMESEILSRSRELQEVNDRLRASAEERQRLLERLEELDRLKAALYANVSHELRTPLTLILGVARRRRQATTDEAESQDLSVVERNARTLLRHVNNLLDVSKLEAGEMTARYARVDLARLVRLVCLDFGSAAEERRLTLAVSASGPIPAEVDVGKVRRVLSNLLVNALAFTPEGGRIAVSVSASGGTARLRVADSGPGIPVPLREAVFERFRQVDGGAARRHDGTGLGLAIVKGFVDLHRGRIRVEDADEGGAAFVVDLPLAAPAGVAVASRSDDENEGPPEPIPGPARPAGERRELPSRAGADAPLVLVVEDNPEMSAFVAETLTERFRVATAHDGEDGFRRALALRPDLIVTDVMMPGTGGDHLIREVRKHPRLADVPVLVLSARADEALRVRLLDSGAQDFVAKPFHVEELLSRASGLVGESRRRRQALEESEERFRRAQKMEAIGRLAGSVAHDFNNLLTVIGGCGELALGALSPGHPALPLVQEIVGAGERATGLTRQLLAFSRRQVLEPKVLDVNQLLGGMRTLLARLLGNGVEVAFRPDPGIGLVKVDPGQLEQVVMNLAVNARDAMPSGGRLTLTTGEAVLEEAWAKERGLAGGGPHVRLTVADTGSGMDAETLAKIFEPFFTTKEEGKGTGLGLSTVLGIVQQSGGEIGVTSAPGEGTAFTIHLPVAVEGAAMGAPVAGEVRRSDLAETILLVEDDDAVRRLTAQMLRSLGYRTLAAGTIADALRLARGHDGPIALLVTDVVMPEMSGSDLAASVKAVRPGIRVLFVSGSSEEAISGIARTHPDSRFLRKPYSSVDLSRVVEESLHA